MAECLISLFFVGMLWIGKDEKGVVKEDTFTFRPRNPVLRLVLGPIPFIPFKAAYVRRDVHNLYILNIYLSRPKAIAALGEGKGA